MERENSLSLDEAAPEALTTSTINTGEDALSARIHLEDSSASQTSNEKHCDSVREQDGLDLSESSTIAPSECSSKPPKRLVRKNTFQLLLDQDEKRRNPRLYGWRATVLTCTATAVTILLINVAAATLSVVKYGKDGSERNFFVGNCDQAGNINKYLHILINMLSTILLSASNYTMQCLHSPTRGEVDRAHAAKNWVEIGIPSWRNRKFVSVRNRVLWWGLGLSSLPLHFVYNSTVFLQFSAQEYQAIVTGSEIPQMIQNNQFSDISTNCTELTWDFCESIYSGFQHEHSDVIFIAPAPFNKDAEISLNLSSQIWDQAFLSLLEMRLLSWNSSSPDDPRYGNLTFAGNSYNVTSCCAKTTTYSPCKLVFDVQIIIVVIMCIAIKALCMFLVVLKADDYPLVTLGDAIASFLEHPDPTTKGMCLVSKQEVLAKALEKPRLPKKWKESSESTVDEEFYAVSARRWVLVTLFLIICLFCGLLVPYLLLGLQPHLPETDAQGTLFSTSTGFGTSLGQTYPTTLTTNMARWGKTKTSILVNTPQVLISLLSVLYNGCLTSMILVRKWNSFSHRRQALRVTFPLGEQKSQYYLTIPYRYAIPLLIIMGVFHWLLSESLFLIRLTAFRGTEVQPQDSVLAIGYSALSMMLTAPICFVLIAVLALKSWKKHKIAMPVAGSCSIAISAACHKSEREETPHLKKVMWGILKDDDGDGCGHCAFTLKLVHPPVRGKLYA